MPNAKSLFEALHAGDVRALARAATCVENRAPGHRELTRAALAVAGRARIAGITGPPGAGKSTLTSALTSAARRSGRRVAVLAVDPSSPFTGGAILGDRIRMLAHSGDEGVYVRSMATRGSMGGLAPAAFEVCLLLDAAGYDLILLETVGAGQDEVDVARVADFTVVVLAPGMGDDVQAIKAGMLEIGDAYALNKADTPGIERLEAEVRGALELSDWTRPVLRVCAASGDGVDALLAAIDGGAPHRDAAARWEWRLVEMFREAVLARLPKERLAAAAREVASGHADPYTVIEGWLQGHINKEQQS